MKSHRRANQVDKLFRAVTAVSAFVVVLLMAGFFVQLAVASVPAMEEFGLSFLWSDRWDPSNDFYGALPSLYGTAMTTIIAMLIAVPAAFLIAMFLVEVAPPLLAKPMSQALDLLAAIPSIIYGMWGVFVLIVWVPALGRDVLTAGLVLALMILPYITAVTRDTFQMVPAVVKESAFGAGATTWEVTRDITLRYGMQGMIGALFLGLGRAVGETMALLFIIGNKNEIAGLMDPGATIASTLANDFGEASGIQRATLFYLALVLLSITFLLQVAAQSWLNFIRKKSGAGL